MMNVHLKNVITAAFPPCIIKRLMREREFPVYTNPDYAVYGQMGDDLVIDGILGRRTHGFYMDIGANDPEALSNTKRFYDRGWNGINIEPNPLRWKQLSDARPRDINLNFGAGPKDGYLDFWEFKIDTLSTFDPEQAKAAILESKLVKKHKVRVRTLTSIMEEYADGKHIDFLSVDVEGFELSVIAGNDWGKFRPELVVMEIRLGMNAKVEAMEDKGYDLVFYNGLNGFFVDGRGG